MGRGTSEKTDSIIGSCPYLHHPLFCLDVVRKYFHLIEIDPVFRIGDSTETTL